MARNISHLVTSERGFYSEIRRHSVKSGLHLIFKTNHTNLTCMLTILKVECLNGCTIEGHFEGKHLRFKVRLEKDLILKISVPPTFSHKFVLQHPFKMQNHTFVFVTQFLQ